MTAFEPLTSDRQSTFRTMHEFEAFAEFTSVEEFTTLTETARLESRDILILGNGSNTLFLRRKVRTAVLRNKLKRQMDVLEDGRVRASSSLMISAILKHCRTNQLDSFYYLASVPATVGGAIAMNAGRGKHHNKTIYDFVESVTWHENNKIITADANDIKREYRWTPFTGKTNKLILEVTFRFPPTKDDDDKISERVRYSKEVQDHSAGNCGSVFKLASLRILKKIEGLKLGTAQYSPKTNNWILSTGKSSRPIVLLIRFVQVIHKVVGSKCQVEFIEVD